MGTNNANVAAVEGAASASAQTAADTGGNAGAKPNAAAGDGDGDKDGATAADAAAGAGDQTAAVAGAVGADALDETEEHDDDEAEAPVAELAEGMVGQAYSCQVVPDGIHRGVPPYQFSMGATGVLPPGLSMAAAGLISGTPSEAGDFTFAVQAHDGNNTAFVDNCQIVIHPAD